MIIEPLYTARVVELKNMLFLSLKICVVELKNNRCVPGARQVRSRCVGGNPCVGVILMFLSSKTRCALVHLTPATWRMVLKMRGRLKILMFLSSKTCRAPRTPDTCHLADAF